MKRLYYIFAFLMAAVLLTTGCLSVFADDTKDAVIPAAIVDLTTQKGYDSFDALAAEYDLVNLKTGEYTIHGTNGKVEWTFITDGDESFTRFYPIVPLDAEGRDPDTGKKDGNEGDFRMTAEIEFSVEECEYISFCYRATPKAHFATNNIYARDDQHSGEFEGTPGMWTAPNLKANGEWQIRTIKIKTSFTAVSGTFKSIRIPIPGRADEYFDLKYIAAFKDKDSANGFDLEKYHEELAKLEPDETAAPTEAPQETDAPSVIETADPAEKVEPHGKGCGGFSASAVALIPMLSAVVLFIRKKVR